MSVIIIDDHLLIRILLADEPSSLRPPGASITTTGLWYHRLCRALANDAVIGSLSRQLGSLDDTVAAQVLGAVVDLPGSIEMVSLRSLGWPMGELVHQGAKLNLLALEALAAARHLSAELCLAEADDNAPLRRAAADFDVSIRVVGD